VTVAAIRRTGTSKPSPSPLPKQMCAKVLSRECWPLSEVKEHWDRLIMRCWVNKGKERTLYQENPLGGILSPEELLKKIRWKASAAKRVLAVFSGTIPPRPG